MRVENYMIVTGKIAAIVAATAITVAAVLAFASVTYAQTVYAPYGENSAVSASRSVSCRHLTDWK